MCSMSIYAADLTFAAMSPLALLALVEGASRKRKVRSSIKWHAVVLVHGRRAHGGCSRSSLD
jgi:hypothetical protein